MPDWRRKKKFSVKKNEKQCWRVSCMLRDVNSISHRFWYSPVSLHIVVAGLEYYFPCHFSEDKQISFPKREKFISPRSPLTNAELVLWSGVSWSHRTLGGNQKLLFSQGGEKQPEVTTSTGEYNHIPLPVWVRTFAGRCNVFDTVSEGNVGHQSWWKITGGISASENCNVFKCLT